LNVQEPSKSRSPPYYQGQIFTYLLQIRLHLQKKKTWGNEGAPKQSCEKLKKKQKKNIGCFVKVAKKVCSKRQMPLHENTHVTLRRQSRWKIRPLKKKQERTSTPSQLQPRSSTRSHRGGARRSQRKMITPRVPRGRVRNKNRRLTPKAPKKMTEQGETVVNPCKRGQGAKNRPTALMGTGQWESPATGRKKNQDERRGSSISTA